MFKIGNSKELPTIPDSLSSEGRDFVKQCLQRNPAERPTAQALLDHPFVRNAPQDDRFDGYDVMSTATAGFRNLVSLSVSSGNSKSRECSQSGLVVFVQYFQYEYGLRTLCKKMDVGCW